MLNWRSAIYTCNMTSYTIDFIPNLTIMIKNIISYKLCKPVNGYRLCHRIKALIR